jgi:Xaa-Pro dipeptidase
MNEAQRLHDFRALLSAHADLAFLPVSADAQYLTGLPRDIPNFGATIHPGAAIEGVWITPDAEAILALPRMSAEFGGLAANLETVILGDHDDPATALAALLRRFPLPAAPRIAIADATHGETVALLARLLPSATFVAASALLRPMRAVKDADEIAAMRAAGAITEAAFAAVLPRLQHGMTELDVVAEVDLQLRRHGALGPSFTTSLYASGPQHPLRFGRRLETWRRRLEPPVSLLFDFGAAVDGTCYDYGRTVFFGEPDADARRAFELVMAAQQAGIAALRDGTPCADVDAAARAVITAAGMGETFRHRLGHGIGLDVHEYPFLTASDPTPVRCGMLFTIEPSITRFDTSSARVEDVVLVGADGGEPLTRGFRALLVV